MALISKITLYKLELSLMKKLGIFSIGAIVLLLFGYLILHGIQSLQKNDPDDTPVKVTHQKKDANDSEGIIRINPASEKMSGITTRIFKPKKNYQELIAYGNVSSTDSLLTDYKHYHSAIIDLQKARIHLLQTSRIYKRFKNLYETKNTAQQDFQTAQINWEMDKADLRSSRLQVQTLKKALLLKWGPVISNWIRQNSKEWRLLSDRNAYIISITIPQNYKNETIPKNIKVENADGRLIKAQFISKAPVLDSRFQENTYYYLCKDISGLTPGMNIKVDLKGEKLNNGFWLPDSAVVWWKGFPWYYLKMGTNDFKPIRIISGIKSGQSWFVKARKIRPKTVVVRGTQLLLSQQLRSEIASKAEDDD